MERRLIDYSFNTVHYSFNTFQVNIDYISSWLNLEWYNKEKDYSIFVYEKRTVFQVYVSRKEKNKDKRKKNLGIIRSKKFY